MFWQFCGVDHQFSSHWNCHFCFKITRFPERSERLGRHRSRFPDSRPRCTRCPRSWPKARFFTKTKSSGVDSENRKRRFLVLVWGVLSCSIPTLNDKIHRINSYMLEYDGLRGITLVLRQAFWESTVAWYQLDNENLTIVPLVSSDTCSQWPTVRPVTCRHGFCFRFLGCHLCRKMW